MRAGLDTNILCSALLTLGGLTDRLYRAWRDGRFELLTSEEQLEEFRRVTRYPRLRPFIEAAAAGAMHKTSSSPRGAGLEASRHRRVARSSG